VRDGTIKLESRAIGDGWQGLDEASVSALEHYYGSRGLDVEGVVFDADLSEFVRFQVRALGNVVTF
jgi:hypothetical protein